MEKLSYIAYLSVHDPFTTADKIDTVQQKCSVFKIISLNYFGQVLNH